MFIVTKSCDYVDPKAKNKTKMFDERYFFDDEKEKIKQYVKEKTDWLWGEGKTEQTVRVESALNPCGQENRKLEAEKNIIVENGHRKWVDKNPEGLFEIDEPKMQE